MKNKQRTTNNEQRTYKAFTLIELVVTVALLTMVISFTSVIFNVSIDAHRTSAASAEIMQKFRAITDQLNRDFRSLQKNAPLLIWFRNDANFIENNRFDQIMFFAAGDFQSIQLFNGSPLVGNVARVHYGQAQSPDDTNTPQGPSEWPSEQRMLARRRHILTADTSLDNWPDYDMVTFADDYDSTKTGYKKNEVYEHDRLSLAQWKTIPIDDYGTVLSMFPDFPPWVDKGDLNTFHKLMCEGVGSFAIQWAYWYYDPVPALSRFRWYPETQHFTLIGKDWFGVHFNIPNASSQGDWHIIEDVLYAGIPVVENFESGFYPRALKFTFTLYDSKGIIKNGKEFTHIVYLGD